MIRVGYMGIPFSNSAEMSRRLSESLGLGEFLCFAVLVNVGLDNGYCGIVFVENYYSVVFLICYINVGGIVGNDIGCALKRLAAKLLRKSHLL